MIDTTDDLDGIEIILYIDEDDYSYDVINTPCIKVRGPRIVLSEMWNKCFDKATGDILMHAGDDIIFRTPDWDKTVINTFSEYLDNIVFLFGNDGSPHNGVFGTHGFIHRKWVETIGYFVPPYFSSDYNDTWLNDVAKVIKRHRHIDILTEHMHPNFNKGLLDITHQERIARHSRDNVDQLYLDKLAERLMDAAKLIEVIQCA